MIEQLWKKLRHALTNERSPWAEEQKKKVYWKVHMSHHTYVFVTAFVLMSGAATTCSWMQWRTTREGE
jgi:hypothetical protein